MLIDTIHPVANAGADKILTCTNRSYVLGTAAIGGNTYTWIPSAGLVGANSAQPTDTVAGIFTVQVTKTANGCITTDAATISIDTIHPVANAGADQTLTCTNRSFVIGTAGVAGNTYTWTPSTGLVGASSAQPTDTVAGIFTVKVTNTTNGCITTDAVTMSIDTIHPVANAGADQTLTCNDRSYVLGAAAVAGNTYSWTPTTGLVGASSAQPTDTVAGIFTVKVTNTTNGCISTDAVTMSIDTLHPVANAGADQTLTCTNRSYVLGTAAIGGNTYTWIPSAGLVGANSAQPTDTVAGIFKVQVTKTANGCITTDAATISIDTIHPVANAGADQTLTCTNRSYVIGTAGVAGNTYSWTPSTGLVGANSAQATDTVAGIFTVKVTNTTNGCISTDAVTMSIDTIHPVANAGADQTLTCNNRSYVLGAAAVAGNTYSWTPTTGLVGASSAQPTDTVAGIFTVKVTNTTNGCISTDAVTMLIDTIHPVANAGADKILTCTNRSYVLGTAAIGGNTYTWIPSAGLVGANSAQPTDTVAGIFTVQVTKTANGCITTDAATISIDTIHPVANAGADQTLTCTNRSFVIGTAGVAGNTYTWTPSTGLVGASSAQPTDTVAGIFTVKVTNTTNGCITTDAVTMSIDTIHPVANAGADQTLTCNDRSYVLGAAAVAGNTYSWTPTTGLVGASSAQPTDTVAGIFTVKVTNTTNGCISTDAVTMSIDTLHPVANAGADQTLTCTNRSYVLGTAAIGGNTYTWIPSAGLVGANSAQPTDTVAGIFTVQVQNNTNGCITTDAVTISIDTIHPVANAGADQTLTCTNRSYVIGTAAVAGNTYSWTPSTGLVGANSAQATDTVAGIFTVKVTNTTNGCISTDDVTMSIDTIHPVANAGADQTLTCSNRSYVLGTAAVAGNTYSWTPSTGLVGASSAQPTDTVAGIFTVKVTNTTNGCITTDAVRMSIDTLHPIADAGVNKTLICTTTFVAIGTPFSSGYIYTWTPALGLDNPSVAQPAATLPNTYTLTVKKASNGCETVDSVKVSIDTIHPIANAGPDQTITCTKKSVSIGTPSISNYTYRWRPAVGSIDSTSAQTLADKQNIYSVTVTNPSNGCQTSDTVTVFKDTIPPVANAGPDDTLTCSVRNITIGTPSVAGNTYSWSPAIGSINPSIAQPTINLPGLYTLTVTKTINGCTATDAVTILKDTIPPTANAGPGKTITCKDSTVVIGTPSVGGNTYSWLPTSGLINPASAQPTATIPDLYTVTVKKLSNGCEANSSVTVSIDTIHPSRMQALI